MILKIQTIEQESNIFTVIFSSVTKSKNKNPNLEIMNKSHDPKAKIKNKFNHEYPYIATATIEEGQKGNHQGIFN